MTPEATFSISIVGDSTEEKWVGTFKCKVRLSHREALRKDQIYRDLVGGDKPDSASDEAKSIATVFSFLGVYLTDAPRWWKDSSNGLDLEDENIISDVYLKTLEKVSEYVKERNAKAEAAKVALEAQK